MRLRRPRPLGEAIVNVHRLLQDSIPAGARAPQGSRLDLDRDRTVLLFFEDVDRDRIFRGDRRLRAAARRLYHALTSGPTTSGFGVAFRSLVTALTRAGYRPIVNDRALARRNPTYPVGLCGYPHVLEAWDLPNPKVLGPGLFDHPSLAPRLFDDARIRSYLVPCAWMRDLFELAYGPRCPIWFAGIDLDEWPSLAECAKDIDLLVYDKIRWDRERLVPTLLTPALAAAQKRGLSTAVLRYGSYEVTEYRQLLRRSRGMMFLCEHETQGLAYQEAMASNVPVLAWSNGYWLDPNRHRYGVDRVPAASVPYFSPECGETFADASQLEPTMDRFFARLGEYQPRRFVVENLSLEQSARCYLTAYRDAARV
jgi:hypothetical protein